MNHRTFAPLAAIFFLICAPVRADFKFTQSGQLTGTDVAASIAKYGYHGPRTSVATTFMKGSYLRIDLPDGRYGIIDLKERREIEVDPRKQSYSAISFDDIRAQNRADEQAEQAMVKNAEPKFTTEVQMASTGRTRVFLGQTAREFRIKLVDKPLAPQKPAEQNRAPLEIESWVAPSVPGFSEVSNFYARLAAALGSKPAQLGTPKGVVELMVAEEDQQLGQPVWVALVTKGILDLGGARRIPNGLPMLQTFGMMAGRTSQPSGFKWGLTVQVTSYSAGSLDESLFRVSSNYVPSRSKPKDMWILSIGQL